MTATLDTPTHDNISHDEHDLFSALLRSPDYPQWRARVEASGGCARPIRLTGSSVILDRDGAVLVERAGEVFAPSCGTGGCARSWSSSAAIPGARTARRSTSPP